MSLKLAKYGGSFLFCWMCNRAIDKFITKCWETPDDWDIKNECQGTELAAGYVRKKGKGMEIWSKRFIVIDDNCLVYYDTHTRRVKKGEIVLAGSQAYVTPGRVDAKKKYYFMVSHRHCGDREFYCKSDMRRAQWIKAITDVSNSLTGRSFFGYLEKLGGARGKVWQTRWCVCTDDRLDYFEKASDTTRRGSLNLRGATVSHITREGKDREYCIEIECDPEIEVSALKTGWFGKSRAGKVYTLAVPSQTELDQWLDILQAGASAYRSVIPTTQSMPSVNSENGSFEMTTNPLAKKRSNSSAASADKEDNGGNDREADEMSDSDTSEELYDVSLNEEEIRRDPWPKMESYLDKKSSAALALGAWQTRYFVLDQERYCLAYYKRKRDIREGNEEKGMIKITDIKADLGIKVHPKNPRVFFFYIAGNSSGSSSSTNRCYELRCLAAEDCVAWVKALTKATSKKYHLHHHQQRAGVVS